MEAMEVRKASAELRAIWVLGNEYLQAAAPWSVFKTDPDKAAMQVRMGLNLVRLYGVLSAPFIPFAAKGMLEAMDASDCGLARRRVPRAERAAGRPCLHRARGHVRQDHRREPRRVGRAVQGRAQLNLFAQRPGAAHGCCRRATGAEAEMPVAVAPARAGP